MDLALAAFVVSVFALGGTLLQAWFMRLADQRAKQADKRAGEHERRLEAQEKRDQDRAQREQRELELAEAEAGASRRARPTTTYLGASGGVRVYRYRVTNIGKGTATDLKAFLIDGKGDIVSDEDPPYVEGGGLLMAENSAEFEIAVRGDAVNRNPLFIRFTWTSEDSQREDHVSRVEVPFA